MSKHELKTNKGQAYFAAIIAFILATFILIFHVQFAVKEDENHHVVLQIH